MLLKIMYTVATKGWITGDTTTIIIINITIVVVVVSMFLIIITQSLKYIFKWVIHYIVRPISTSVIKSHQ